MSNYFSKENTGGAISSRGLTYQDYCALIELFQVVDNNTFKAISSETIDDFTIFIDNEEILYQVKKMQFDINVINEYLEKEITKKQNFIFTSKDSTKYNGLFDKRKEYEQSLISSRSSEEKSKIKTEMKKLIANNKINNSDRYLDSQILIYEDSNIDDILFAKATRWLDNQVFQLKDKDDFLDKLRLKISDLRSIRGELNKDNFNEIVDKYKLSNQELIDIKDLENILGWYTDANSIVEISNILKLFSYRTNDICQAEDLISSGNYQDALEIYKFIAKMEKNHKNISLLEFKITDLYYKNKDYQNAIEICNKYNSKNFLLLKGMSLGQIGKHKDALIVLNNIKKEEQDYIVYFNIAVSHMYLDDFENAIINYEKSIEMNNTFEGSYLNLAICQYKLDPLNKYILSNLDKSLKINPYFDNALSQKAETLRFLGKYAKAKTIFKQSLSINPLNPTSLYGLAMCLFQNRKYKEGLLFFNYWLQNYFKEEIKNNIIICDVGYKNSISLMVEPKDNKLDIHIDNNLYKLQSNINRDFIFIGIEENEVNYPVIGKRYDRLSDFLDTKKHIIEILKLDSDFIRTDNSDIHIISSPILEAIDVNKNVAISIKEENDILINIKVDKLIIQGTVPKGSGYYDFVDNYNTSKYCQIVLCNGENNQRLILETYMRCTIY